jgi:hypothetical protein
MGDGARSWERDDGTPAMAREEGGVFTKSPGDIEQLSELGDDLSKPSY